MDPNSDHHEYCTGGFDPEDIVISGMSGRFPESDSVKELKEGLYNKKNFVVFTDKRFEKGAYKAPYDSPGCIRELDKLDWNFFRIANIHAQQMDPGGRLHLEVTYEAIADAGVDALDLKGQRIGVINATISEDTVKINTSDESFVNLNSIRSMSPNKTSYCLDFIGPSYGIDAACASSAIALWNAINVMKMGHVDACVVTGCQVNLHPCMLVGYLGAGIVTPTGNSIPFDARSDGMIRSEAVAAIFLQRAKHARRVYASIPAIRFYAAGNVLEGINVPSYDMQKTIMMDTLNEANVTIHDVDFMEAHGTGTQVGDKIELNAIADTFCKDRDTPFYVGSIKSNIGHTEASSGICSIIKSSIILDCESIAPNIKYEIPNPNSPALLEGKLVVPTEPTPYKKDYIPINSLGFGGTLVQTLLKKNPIGPREKKQEIDLPRLVLFPATTEEAISTVFDYVQNTPDLPNEFFALLNKLSFGDPAFKAFRGYALFPKDKSPVKEIKPVASKKRQVWYVMTGMGCQWPGMGLQLMKIDTFANSLKKSAEILKPYGVDLFAILQPNSNSLSLHRKIINSFVSICAIQIALIDVLKLLGITPDGIVGHSTGELLCAYADGCLTAEQTILSSYYRGLAIETSNLKEGGMAATGLSWSQAKKMCPEGIYPACDNASDSVTISGLKEPLEQFIEKLKQENIFVRAVNSHGFAFHCEYVHEASGALRKQCKKSLLIQSPDLSAGLVRVTQNLNGTYQSAKWPLQNTSCTISCPSILKRGIGNKAYFAGLMKRNDPDNLHFIMDSIGKLYNEGLNPKIERLYPPVKFPVPRGTPMIADLIRWNHSDSLKVPRYTLKTSEYSKEFKFDKAEAYILDHKIDGRSLFPATGYAFLAWDALASKLQKNVNEMSVVIEDFKIHRATVITPQVLTKFYVNILDASGRFEITEGKSMVASGIAYECKNMTFEEDPPVYTSSDVSMSSKDIYEELKRAGYEYGPHFQGLVETNIEGTAGLVQWRGKWIPFLDSLLLFFGILSSDLGFCLPTGALHFKIDPTVFAANIRPKEETENEEEENVVQNIPVTYNKRTRTCRSVGIEISNLVLDPAPQRRKEDNPTIEEYTFVPYITNYTPKHDTASQFSTYLQACNELISKIGKSLKKDVKQFQFSTDSKEDFCLEEYIEDVTENQHLLKSLKAAVTNADALKENRKEWFANYYRSASKDMLNSAMVNEDSLRIMLEIIVENTFRKLSVLEINRNFPVVLASAAEILSKYSHLKFKKSTLIASKSIVVEQELLDEYGIQLQQEDALEGLSKDKAQDLAISSFACGPPSELKNLLHTLTSVTKINGFIMLFFKEKLNCAEQFISSISGEEITIHSQEVLEKFLQEENLVILSKISDSFGGSVYLLRSPSLVAPQKVLQVTEDNYGWVEKVKEELFKKDSGMVWLVSEDSPTNGIIGMVNCLKQEPGGERIRCVFICQKKQENNFPAFSLENPFYNHLVTKNLVMNVFKNETWGSFRHVLIKETKIPRPAEYSYVNCRKYGDLSTFEWIESNVKYTNPKNKKLIHIYNSALNFRDVMLATGKLSIATTRHLGQGNAVLGLEFSGREDGTGKRVCGFASARGMATAILAEPAYLLDVPESWTLEEAATVPVVYATCYYALIVRAKLLPGESILIHSGTGGIGIAALNIALSLNCEVFTTVGNDEKKQFLKKKFPQLKDENIGNSRNISFEKMVKERTNGRGVDVVLNSLADDKFKASLRCVAKSGRFVEIGKYDLALDREIGLKMFLENIAFHAVFLDQMFDSSPKTVRDIKEVMKLITDGIKSGVVKPLERTVFDRNAIEDAFRYMSKGVHVGKVLLKIREEEQNKIISPKVLMLPAVPETQFYHNKVYIIIGGLGGFGMEVTKWIISRGGFNIILTSRYGARTPYHFFCLKKWENQGANVQVSTLNVAIRNEAEKLLKEASRIGPVGGIFNSAVVLQDAFMDCQTAETYEQVCAPKAAASKNLDQLSRKLCPSLDYFVCFSSISCGRGNAGQTNYGYANSVMERICEERRRVGLHGLAIQWGIIGEVGVVHRHMGDDAMIAGVMAQKVKSCLDTMDAFCQQESPVVTTYVTAQQTKKSVQNDALQQIIKSIGYNETNMNRTLGEVGLDSIVGVEIKQIIESYSDVTVSIQEMQEMTLEDIKALFEKVDSERSDNDAPALLATTNVKLPPVLLHNEPIIPLSKDATGEPIFIVSIGETDLKSFQVLAKGLSRPVYALVWTKDAPASDLESLASWYLQLIQKTVAGPFHIVGHSLSGTVAFEMALQSEKRRSNLKSVTLLNGSDDLLDFLNKEDAETEGKKDPEATALYRFVQQFVSGAVPRLEDELKKVTGQEERIRTILNYITNSSSETVNKGDISEAASHFIRKYNLVKSYIPKTKLSKDINIIEDSSKLLANDISGVKELFSEEEAFTDKIKTALPAVEITNEDVKLALDFIHSFLKSDPSARITAETGMKY
ncbi:Fatty acid synthase like protein [Argiope bruennichi]|uniref:Fatty acid synthase n=1 Tax=Argiope bruennichi TaxID=94029 RepID=A0A8T0EPJ0_ARGBR|nr:Fatty acid synthase like protein [Argiope bruennichi]